jgi:hypothetical protein
MSSGQAVVSFGVVHRMLHQHAPIYLENLTLMEAVNIGGNGEVVVGRMPYV